MTDKIKVTAAKQDGATVIWETHPDHVSDTNSTGEIFVSGNGEEVEVALTSEVQKRLTAGTLVKVEGILSKALSSFSPTGQLSAEKAVVTPKLTKNTGAG